MDPLTLTAIKFIIGGVLSSGTFFWVIIKLFIALKGKKIVVLGRRAIGKTVLQNYLSQGNWFDIYTATVAPEDLKERLFINNKKILAVKKSKDLPGFAINYTGDTIKLIKKSDLIILLLPAKELLESDDEAIQESNMIVHSITEFIEDQSAYKQNEEQLIFLVGNYFEDKKLLHFSKRENEDLAKDEDRFVALDSIQEIKANMITALKKIKLSHRVHVVLGSLASLESTEKLVNRIFSELY
ncbi:MAG: hypothetical protein DSM106950_10205 [Stigonema ocellatum SAG 48.90 = DSM 106950]|nr:hypothetical protein [Stigonema ocellatum SAG 48.90 = DSM 106950]